MRVAPRTSRVVNGLLDHPWLLLGLVGLVATVIWATGSRQQDHYLTAEFDQAVNLFDGLDVRIDGIDAGKIRGVEVVNGKAIVKLGINDEMWPLHQGTKAVLRFGSTIGNGTRIMDLEPGPESAPVLADDGIIQSENTVEATEFDDVFDTFNADTRASLQGMFKGFGDTFEPRQPQLASAIRETKPGLEAVGGLATDLVRDEPALRAFVVNTDRVMETLAARRDNISDLMQVGAATFSTFAANTQGITGSLDRLPSTLRETRTTLARLDGSIGHLDNLFTDLSPGARELGPLARDLRPALANLRATVPVAIQTFRVARQSAPSIAKLLTRVPAFDDRARPALSSLEPMVGCIRPYAPELAGLLTTWSSWTKNYDATSHIGRLHAEGGPTSFTDTPDIDTPTIEALGVDYAMLKPPGFNAGKPVFQPQCGITEKGLDGAYDPEDDVPGGSTAR